MKQVKEPKPILTAISVRDTSTNTTLFTFPPTSAGEKRAERYRGLAGLEIVKHYDKGE